MQKVLVTGGLGYIGSHVVVELQKMNFEVIIIDDLSNSSLDVLSGIKKITGIKPDFEKIDLKKKSNVRGFFNRHSDLDGAIHFAAAKAVSESVNNPLKYYENNICSLVYLLEELNKMQHQLDEVRDELISEQAQLESEKASQESHEWSERFRKARQPKHRANLTRQKLRKMRGINPARLRKLKQDGKI